MSKLFSQKIEIAKLQANWFFFQFFGPTFVKFVFIPSWSLTLCIHKIKKKNLKNNRYWHWVIFHCLLFGQTGLLGLGGLPGGRGVYRGGGYRVGFAESPPPPVIPSSGRGFHSSPLPGPPPHRPRVSFLVRSPSRQFGSEEERFRAPMIKVQVF